MEFSFNWKHKDYEIRKTHSINSNDEYWELVKWQEHNGKKTCFTLAHFKGTETCDLVFIGNRPFEYIDDEDLGVVWDALKMCQATLEDYQKITKYLR